jgi:succinoglycan biosynthesis protein ExoL
MAGNPSSKLPDGFAVRIAYFVHDLNDPAVAKRIAMLRAAGVSAVVTGFWRGARAPSEIAGCQVVPLGRTFDAKLGRRCLAVLREAARAANLAEKLGAVDLYLARNLEMLMVAVTAKRLSAAPVPIVYEVLDIHRLLLSDGAAGRALRWIERALMRDARLLITSSPAFVREYYERRPFRQRKLPTALVENKLLMLGSSLESLPPEELVRGPPWRIGWFGMIRCRKSFDMLSNLARRRPDLVAVEIAGRPTRAVFGNFEREAMTSPGVEYLGPYRPEQLRDLYGRVHFNWAIDYFEEGANSEWLLPNRIYEGGNFNAIPVALARTETARWLEARNLGVLLEDPAIELEAFLERLTPAHYAELKLAAYSAPRSLFVADRTDCDRFAEILEDAAFRSPSPAFSAESSRPIP